jgi:cytochrome c peroxidase
MKFPTYADSIYTVKYKLTEDPGRASVTKDPADIGMWRVPTLRNLVYTAPYMHTGSVKTLPEAVRVMGSTQLDKTLSDAEVADIVAFLESLSGQFPEQTMPRLPPTPGDLLE